jgi:hypothetical protein
LGGAAEGAGEGQVDGVLSRTSSFPSKSDVRLARGTRAECFLQSPKRSVLSLISSHVSDGLSSFDGADCVRFRVPDVRSAKFVREAHRQSLRVGRSAHEREDQAFVDAASDWPAE